MPLIDIEVVRAIADRVAVMQHGGIVEQGGKEVVFSPSPEPSRCARFSAGIGSSPDALADSKKLWFTLAAVRIWWVDPEILPRLDFASPPAGQMTGQ